jgi:steroid delta-isomerase-like uncharacterized protein
MAFDPKAIIHRWFDEVWNQGRLETIDELFSPDSVAHGLGEAEAVVRGPDAFKPFVLNLRQSIPDIHIDVEDIIMEGDRAAFRVLLQGTHQGAGLGVPPSGRRVRVKGIIMVRFAGGRIMEGWNSWDQLGLLQQIGAAPGPGTADRFLARS